LDTSAFAASSGRLAISALSASAAVRSVVCRIVFAWKKFQVSEALMLSSIPLVCALLPSVSESARKRAVQSSGSG
jgi:hypothetical protein